MTEQRGYVPSEVQEKPLLDQFNDVFGGVKNIMGIFKKEAGRKKLDSEETAYEFNPEEMLNVISDGIIRLDKDIESGKYDEILKNQDLKDKYERFKVEYENRSITQKHKIPKDYKPLTFTRRGELLLKNEVVNVEAENAQEGFAHLLKGSALESEAIIKYLNRLKKPKEDPIVLITIAHNLLKKYDKEKVEFQEFGLVTPIVEEDIDRTRERVLKYKWEKEMAKLPVFEEYKSAEDLWNNNIEGSSLLEQIDNGERDKDDIAELLFAVSRNMKNINLLRGYTQSIFWDDDKEKKFQHMRELFITIAEKYDFKRN